MNDKKVLICAAAGAALVICSIFFGGNALLKSRRSALENKSELVVAINSDMPGIFAAEDGLAGYVLQILESYAAYAGVELSILDAGSAKSGSDMLAAGGVDMAAGIFNSSEKLAGSVVLYDTYFSVLGKKVSAKDFAGKPDSVFDALKNKKVVISRSFQSTKIYHMMLDSLRNTEFFVSSQDPVDVFKEIAAGKYDYYMCEKTEAMMGVSLDRNLKCLHTFDERIQVTAAFGNKRGALAGDFAQWLSEYRMTDEYAMLSYLYFEHGAASQMISGHHYAPKHVISPYDHVMREVGEREGADWRLMSAIAYNESRFKPDVVSKNGAKGLMQIMPVVSRQFGVPDEKVMEPEVNITLAVKLLNKIERMMEIPDDVPYRDRMALVLASYNCGIGHVSDARRLAVKYGADKNSWDDVSEFLKKKAHPEYYQDEVVSSGRFRGGSQTIAFVNKVMGRYSSYCTVAML